MNEKIDIWTDIAELVEDQLNLQVEMQFDRHHQFMMNSGLADCRGVMDLGTGNGTFLKVLAKAHPEITFTGVDNMDHMIDNAKTKTASNLNWAIADVSQPSTVPGVAEIDGALMRYVLLHLTDTSEILSKLHGTFRKGTRLWIIDLDLENYRCDPPHEAFDLIRGLVKTYCDENGKDANVGGKLVDMLKKAGFGSIVREIEPLNTDTTDISLLQRFIKQEVIAYRTFLPGALTDDQFAMIERFIDELPSSGTFLNYGVTLVSAIS